MPLPYSEHTPYSLLVGLTPILTHSELTLGFRPCSPGAKYGQVISETLSMPTPLILVPFQTGRCTVLVQCPG